MQEKVLVTPRSFGKVNPEPKILLEKEKFEVVYNNTGKHLTEKEMMAKVSDITGLIVGTDPVTKKVINNASKLRIISKYGVGLDNIDIDVATEKGIMVTYTPGTNSEAVAELTMGLIMDVARNISAVDRKVRTGDWIRSRGFELKDKTIGLLGTGRIGARVGELAHGFDMSVICYDINENEKWAKSINARYCTFTEVLSSADIISIHLPLNAETKNLIGREEFTQMKDTSILINTARGGIVEVNELVDALDKGVIGGAGFDVFTQEPPENKELFKLDNMVLTSHIASHTKESITAMGILAAQNLINGLNGEEPDFIVNPEYN